MSPISSQDYGLNGFMSKPNFVSSLVLASRSPRREHILQMLGVTFTTKHPDYAEILPEGLPHDQVPEYFARGKAACIANLGPTTLVLGSDTVVLLDDKLLGKPENAEHAFEMLSALNGRTHRVITGVALARQGVVLNSGSALTEVTFAKHPSAILRSYADSIEPLDKAGAYAIQGYGARLVDNVRGCFYNVMGLPIQLTMGMLESQYLGDS